MPEKEQPELFWADQMAADILGRKTFHYLDKPYETPDVFTVKTSASISGVLHIGRLSDTIRGASVVQALKEQGAKVEFIWVAEDMDPLRKVPAGVPASYAEHIGMPVTDIPDPAGCHSTYAAHHVAEYLKVIDEFVHTDLKKYSMREEYQRGSFKPFIQKILEQTEKVIEIQNRYRTNPLPPQWSPWTPICEKCGKISTAKVTGISEGKISYECTDYQFETTTAIGCGHRGVNDPLKGQGKLMWKSEWAAQWARWGVCCEGAGKEYQVPNSAFWINGEIVEKVLSYPMPTPIFYEHLMVDGVKMSASLGNVIYPKDWLAIASPQLLRFLYNKRLNKTRSLVWKELPQLFDEYDHAGRVAFEMTPEPNEREKKQLTRLYAISNFEKPEEPLAMGYAYAAVLAQTYDSDGPILEALRKTGHHQPLLEKRILARVAQAKEWVLRYAPAEMKFSVQDAVPEGLSLSDAQREALHRVAAALKKEGLSEKDVSEAMFAIAKDLGIGSKDIYQAAYRVLLNQDRGPRLAGFLLALGDRAIKLFESA